MRALAIVLALAFAAPAFAGDDASKAPDSGKKVEAPAPAPVAPAPSK